MFGDKDQGPISGLFNSTLGQLDRTFGQGFTAAGGDNWFGTKPKTPAPPSLVTAPTPPQSVDTPGRHKSLLGA